MEGLSGRRAEVTGLVVDGSAVIAMLLGERPAPEMTAFQFRVTRQGAFAPSHFKLDVANALLLAARRGRLQTGEARAYLVDLDALPISIDDRAAHFASGVSVAAAERHGLTAYDAAYLELALRLGAELATLDADLATAARAERVPLVDLGLSSPSP
jgi:predicted nucleic acid-binding protein